MNILSLDTETSYFHSNPYDQTNKPLVCYSYATDTLSGQARQWDEDSLWKVQALVSGADLVVGFNFKFDLAWLKKQGVDFSNVRIWDVQLAEFIISRQRWKYPSLRECCVKYGVDAKLDVVKTEYWEKGIDTKDVPWPILSEYAAHDAKITLECYHKQLEHLSPAQVKLVKLMCQDLVVLQEMEQNGLTFDEDLCNTQSLKLDDEISQIKKKLAAVYPDVPINFGSNDQLSAFLYGGTVTEVVKEMVGFYKTGLKKGQPKFGNKEVVHQLPRLFNPIKGSEHQKEGVWGTAEPVLQKIKPLSKKHGWIVEQLLQLSKQEKLNGTYYKGLPALNKEMNWKPGKLHGQLNQTLAVSGRLSASKPNQQNFASDMQDIFVSEYD